MTVGVRPENIELAAGGMPLMVELVEPLGSETLVHGRMADGTMLLVKLQGTVDVGARIEVGFAPSFVHLFDARTGARL